MVTSAREKSALRLLPSFLPEGARRVDEVCSSRVVEGGTYLVGGTAPLLGERHCLSIAWQGGGLWLSAGREARS